jgi:hypothetical protein
VADFAGQVEDWVRNSQALLEGVFHESAQRVTDVMTTPRGQGGNLPVDTGYLWHSIQASNVAPPQINPASKGSADQKYALESGPIALTINNTPLGGTVYVCATASYAAHVNYGTSKQPAALFVEQAAQQWPQIVNQVQAELKGRLNAQ